MIWFNAVCVSVDCDLLIHWDYWSESTSILVSSHPNHLFHAARMSSAMIVAALLSGMLLPEIGVDFSYHIVCI